MRQAVRPRRPFGFVDHLDVAEVAGAGERHAAVDEALVLVERQVEDLRRIVAPVLDAVGGDREHIVARFRRQPIDLEKTLQPVLAGIVGGSRIAEIAVARLEFVQILCRLAERLDDIEAVVEPSHLRRSRHELRDAFGTLGADGIGPEQAFAPDEPGEEGRGQVVDRRIVVDHAADIAGEVFLADAERLGGVGGRRAGIDALGLRGEVVDTSLCLGHV
ncbi:hypothetical protein N182_24315 [Sinorhizobium sp. GL2]|nr:hypothetical protein N182_24315 [Sinorhizobium sp. GL2]